MASRIGMGYRRQAAEQRIDAALDQVISGLGVGVPPFPARARDADLNEVLRLEWIATALEALVDDKPTAKKAPAKKDGAA